MFKSIIKRVFKAAALAGTIIYGGMIAPEIHNHYLRWSVENSIVKVLHVQKNGGGTGFMVQAKSGKEFILTNRHVCEIKDSNDDVRLSHPKFKKTVIRHVVYMDKDHDICLVEAHDLGLKSLKLGTDQAVGDTMYIVGHPGLRQLTVSSGEYIGRTSVELVYDVKTKEECPGNIYEIPYPFNVLMGVDWLCTRDYPALETTTVIYGGNSGSPAFNKWGHVIGIAFAGNTEQEHNNFVVPLRYIKSVLNQF